MLIVMKYRDVHSLTQRFFDDEAFGCFDVLQVDCTKRRLKPGHGLNEILRIRGIDFDVERIDV